MFVVLRAIFVKNVKFGNVSLRLLVTLPTRFFWNYFYRKAPLNTFLMIPWSKKLVQKWIFGVNLHEMSSNSSTAESTESYETQNGRQKFNF